MNIETLKPDDILVVKDPMTGERLAKFVDRSGHTQATDRTNPMIWIQRRYNSRPDKWGPKMLIPISDVVRVEVRV